MTISKEQKQQNNDEGKACFFSCEKADEVKEYMEKFKQTGDVQYVDRAHYCLFKMRDREKGLV